jgi:5-methylcytosine-specific restriction endonuclease McrA
MMTKIDRLFLNQRGNCFFCEKPMVRHSWTKYYHDGWTRDHFIPQSLGGESKLNIVLAHASCNTAKSSRLPTDAEVEKLISIYGQIYRAEIEARIKKAQRLYDNLTCAHARLEKT